MTPEEILKIDAERNQKGLDVTDLIGYINSEIRMYGAHVVQEGNTLILFKTVKNKKAEFHTFNAGNAADLAQNVLLFLQLMKKLKYKAAFTEYKNPLISKLFMTYGSPKYKIDITNLKSGGYRAEVTL